MNENSFIYAICHPITGEPRYIGQTIKGKARFAVHMSPSGLKPRTKKNNWIKSLIGKGLRPKFEIVEYADKSDLNDLEIFYISYFKFLGFSLLNHTDGGDTPVGHTNKSAVEKLSRRLVDLQSKTIYPSLMEFCRRNNLRSGTVSECLNGKHFQVKGYFISWLPNEVQDLAKWCDEKLTELKERKKATDNKEYQFKKIVCVQTGEIFQSVKEAARKLGVKTNSISSVLTGARKHTHGLVFAYV